MTQFIFFPSNYHFKSKTTGGNEEGEWTAGSPGGYKLHPGASAFLSREWTADGGFQGPQMVLMCDSDSQLYRVYLCSYS